MTTLTLISTGPPVATSFINITPVSLLTTAAETAVTASAVSSSPSSFYVGAIEYSNYCPKSYSLAEAAGVGIAIGVFVASIIILAFFLIRRRSTRARKLSPTIAPDVLVRGPMVDNGGEWEEYHEMPKDIIGGGESPNHKDPPMYTTGV